MFVAYLYLHYEASGQDDIKQVIQMALKAQRLVYVTLKGEPGCDKHNSQKAETYYEDKAQK